MGFVYKAIALDLIFFLLLWDGICSQTSQPGLILETFSLKLWCNGFKEKPGFNAQLIDVQVCQRSKNNVSTCSLTDRASDSNSDSDNDDDDDDDKENDYLFKDLVKSVGQKICKGQQNTILLNITEVVWKSSRGDTPIRTKAPDQPARASVDDVEDDNAQATINRLKIGVAVGTILGFLFGILVTGIVILVYTKKLQKHRNAMQQDALRGTHEFIEKGDEKYESVNYMYCDVNEGNFQGPADTLSRRQNTSKEDSRKYHDCNLNTYNHLNENETNTTITPSTYDHVGKTSADTIQPVGEYKLLEPMKSEKDIDVGTLPNGKLNNQDARADSVSLTGEYKLLEPMKSGKDGGILQSQNPNSNIRDACADSFPISGEYKLLDPMNSKPKKNAGSLQTENVTGDIYSKTNDSNYFELENVKCQAKDQNGNVN